MGFQERMKSILEARKDKKEYRQLSAKSYAIDFTSNDYLGFARSAWIQNQVAKSVQKKIQKYGATGSRLLSGNSEQVQNLERKIAQFHNAESALVFNSGFDANLGVISTLCRGEEDVLIYDELVHASIHQGMRLSGCEKQVFRHNNLSDLERILAKHKFKRCFVLVESVYSMDGDKAPLKAIVELKKRFAFELIVDEAHAIGVFGKQGRGLCESEGVEADCLARIYTFGKAMGTHGAAVLGSAILSDYLINFCKTFIYTTALSASNLWSVEHSYNFLLKSQNQIVRLFEMIDYFNSVFAPQNDLKIIGEGPIFGLEIGDAEHTRKLAAHLNTHGFDIRPIVYPTVARGKERLRICLHSFNTKSEIDALSAAIQKFKT